MNQPSRMLMLLNMVTRARHAAVDSVWLEVMSPRLTVTQYTALLARAYGFEAPLEAAFAYTRNLATMTNLRERARAGVLAQDLLALGLSPQQVTELPQCWMIEPFRSVSEALGWMYAAERSTLLFAQLHGALRTHLPEVAGACAYLGCYDGVASQRWAALGRVLDAVAASDEQREQLVAAAHIALDCQRAWLRDESSPDLRRRVG
jgi:heme oxygenase (biliverdin-IX-beta and delta-forming)